MLRDIVNNRKCKPNNNLVEEGMSYGEILKTSLDERANLTQSKVQDIIASIDQKKQNLEVKSIELESLKVNYKLALQEIFKIQSKANLAKENVVRALAHELKLTRGGLSLKEYMLGVSVLTLTTPVYANLIRQIRGASDSTSYAVGFFFSSVIALNVLFYMKFRKRSEYKKQNHNKESLCHLDHIHQFNIYKSSTESLCKISQILSPDERKKLNRDVKKEFHQIEKQIRNETKDQRRKRLDTLHNDMIKEVERFYESDIGKSIQTQQDNVNNIEQSLVSERDRLTKAELDLKTKQKQAQQASVKSFITQMTNNVISAVIQLAQDTQQSFSHNAHQSTDLNSYMQASEELIHGSSEIETKKDYIYESTKNNFKEISSCIESLKKHPSKNDFCLALKIILATKGLEVTPEAAEKLILEVAPTSELCEITTEHYQEFVRHICRRLFASVDDLSLVHNEFPKVETEANEVSDRFFLS